MSIILKRTLGGAASRSDRDKAVEPASDTCHTYGLEYITVPIADISGLRDDGNYWHGCHSTFRLVQF
ncbi:MAG: hypothetical protein ABR903_08905 [Thermodesulfovibrionales bacterium]|jgi:hypothetical protein